MTPLKLFFVEHYNEDIRILLFHAHVIWAEDFNVITLNDLKRARSSNADRVAVIVKALAAKGIVLPATRKELEFRDKAPELWKLHLGTVINEKLKECEIYKLHILLRKTTKELKAIFSQKQLTRLLNIILQNGLRLLEPDYGLLKLKLGAKILERLLQNNITSLDELMALEVSELYSFYGKDKRAADIVLNRLEKSYC